MTASTDALSLSRAFLAALNAGDRSSARALLSEDVAFTEPMPDDNATGPDAVLDNIWSYRNSFPDMQIEVTDGFGTDSRAATQFTATGTYEPYTYGSRVQRLAWRGCLIVAAQQGRIVRADMYTDWLGPLEQLGGEGIVPVLKRSGAPQ